MFHHVSILILGSSVLPFTYRDRQTGKHMKSIWQDWQEKRLCCIAIQHSREQHSTAQHMAQHSTAQHSVAQHVCTAHHSTSQHNTAQHSTAQHSTAQHSTAQHVGTARQGSQYSTRYGTTQHSRACLNNYPTKLVCETIEQTSATLENIYQDTLSLVVYRLSVILKKILTFFRTFKFQLHSPTQISATYPQIDSPTKKKKWSNLWLNTMNQDSL